MGQVANTAGSSPVSRPTSSIVSLLAPDRLLHGKQAVKVQERGDSLFHQTVSNGHLPHFLANTCLAFHLPTKVFASSHRQVLSNWYYLSSNYRAYLEKKQVRQVFYQKRQSGSSRLVHHRSNEFACCKKSRCLSAFLVHVNQLLLFLV
jgi:hypothetical protein